VRMKEVCERTGLTDRAVRLYIDNGLLSPLEENSYTGRKSIQFSEKDVEILDAIATLRKADFSIADIRDMQLSPDRVHTILDAHKQKIAGDIENKQRILHMLEKIESTDSSLQYIEIAEQLRQSASRNYVPKEDSNMHIKDFQQIIRHRIPSVAAFALLLIEVVLLTPLFIQAAFAETVIASGGNYNNLYTFTWELFFRHIPLFAAEAAMIAASAVLFSHILCGNKKLLAAGGILCILAAAVMLFLPAEIRETLYRHEFYSYRYSFMAHFLYETSPGFDIFIRSLKFLPLTAVIVLTCIGYIRHKELPSEDIR